MLDQRDLRPIDARLRAEQASRKPDAKPARRGRGRTAAAKRRGG